MTSIQHKTALAFLETFDTLDVEAHIAIRTPDCRQIITPASVGYNIEMDNDKIRAHLTSIKEVIANIPVTPKEIFADGSSNLVTIWATSVTTFREEAMDAEPGVDWSYNGEYMFMLTLNEAGDKIARVVEFLDSAKVARLLQLMERARRNLAAKKG